MSEETSGSKKYWLRAVIIIAFGVPVLLEVLTFFNLIKFRLWDDGSSQEASSPKTTVTEVRKYAAGDTLFADSRQIITIHEMHIYVNPEAWDFELSLETSASGADAPGAFTLSIDSLQLDNNSIIRKSALWERKSTNQGEERQETEGNESEDEEKEWETEWTIPNGRLPTQLFITWQRDVLPDSTAVIHKTFAIEKPPIRYHD